MEGYNVAVAADAVSAVRLLPQFRPDLILLDLHMPMLDGESFLRGMSGLSVNVPFILISGRQDVAQVADRTGAAGFLPKPFESPQLLSMLDAVLP
jgi:DNA-binding response OmpR family regulator